jgi:hypothetical protein
MMSGGLGILVICFTFVKKSASSNMSQAELYQSVLLKLGQLPAASLAEVDAFLAGLAKKRNQNKPARYKTRLAKIAGAWKDWDDQEFNAFLDTTRQIRREMFADRTFSL